MDSLFAFDDATCHHLAKAHGTPCFAYSGAGAEAQFNALGAALPPRVRLPYAVKANAHLGLLTRFAALGASFDCASIGELNRVEALALPPERTFFAGPGKREAELRKALTQACIRLAREKGHSQVVLHTTQAMQVAWQLYERLGFARAEDLDFSQQELPMFGFRLPLAPLVS